MSKTVLITGASGGIGSATAIKFAENGWNVIMNYNHSFAPANILCNSLATNGFSVMTFQADVTVPAQVKGMIKAIINKYGKIDALINNAGISQQKLFTDIAEEDWDNMINTNLKSVFNCCQAVLPYMINKKSGKIVNISSMWGITGASCEVHYSASKAGIIGLTKALAKEVAPSSINVNCIAPGLIETKMNDNIDAYELSQFVNEIPLGRMGLPSEIADLIYFLSSEQSDYITGQVIAADGGITI